MIRILLNRVIPTGDSNPLNALKEAIESAIGTGKYIGIVKDETGINLLFTDITSTNDQNAALQLALNFDINARTAAEIEETNQKADVQSLLAIADNAITAIGNELTAITADGTALTAAGSLAAVKPIVQNILDRQAAMDTRQRAIIKALKRIRMLV